MPYLSRVALGSAAVCLGFALALTPRLSIPASAAEAALTPRPGLDASDEIAALEALQVALTEVTDGASYVWYRGNGRLSGVVQPTMSFKDAGGRICRHVVMLLVSGAYSKRTEGIACRLDADVWQLDG